MWCRSKMEMRSVRSHRCLLLQVVNNKYHIVCLLIICHHFISTNTIKVYTHPPTSTAKPISIHSVKACPINSQPLPTLICHFQQCCKVCLTSTCLPLLPTTLLPNPTPPLPNNSSITPTSTTIYSFSSK